MTPDQLLELIDPKSYEKLVNLGGQQGLMNALETSENGLSPETIESNRSRFGTNVMPEPVSKTFLQFVWEAFQDKTLLVLMAAAAVEIGVGIYKAKFAPEADREEGSLLDGGAILVAGNSS